MIEYNDIDDLVSKLSNNFTEIICRDVIGKYPIIDWGNNGIGDRWAKKKFNYTVIQSSGKIKLYSENDNDIIDDSKLKDFIDKNKKKSGIIGIYVHSKRLNILNRPIREDIRKEIKKSCCVSCGTSSEIICDHKNDIYNDDNVLDTNKQLLSDFQPLCNHCNLQKRQVFKDETKNQKIYSAKKLEKYKVYTFDFPWEKKAFDKTNPDTKKDTYWYDPVEFNTKICIYSLTIIPILFELKIKIKKGKINYYQ
jgi:hypothetical protein